MDVGLMMLQNAQDAVREAATHLLGPGMSMSDIESLRFAGGRATTRASVAAAGAIFNPFDACANIRETSESSLPSGRRFTSGEMVGAGTEPPPNGSPFRHEPIMPPVYPNPTPSPTPGQPGECESRPCGGSDCGGTYYECVGSTCFKVTGYCEESDDPDNAGTCKQSRVAESGTDKCHGCTGTDTDPAPDPGPTKPAD